MTASGPPVESTHTLAEILSQPEVWLSCLRELSSNRVFQSIYSRVPARHEWLFVGCGTSFYLAEGAAASWLILTGQPARALPASELLLFPQTGQLDAEDLQVVVISRSGRTSEAVKVAELLTEKYKLPIIGVTCASDSDLSKVCDCTLVLPSADEKSMVMTRSFTSMLLALICLAAPPATNLAGAFAASATALASRLRSFSNRIESFVAEKSFADYIYLAQGPFYPIAREAALKVTEMSCSYAQSYHTLEFRHGPKSIVSPETCITFFLSESGMSEESEVLTEMKELGGTIIAVCNRAKESIRSSADLVFEMETDVPEVALLPSFITPAQLLGFHLGIKKGFNPDEPKNLSRVVILE